MKFIHVNTPIIGFEEKKYVMNCIKKNEITNGRYIKKFEDKFAKFHKKKYGITVSNGTAALEIAIKSLNLKKNSEVIIPTFSIISSLLCVLKNELTPVFVDCSLDTWNCKAEDIIFVSPCSIQLIFNSGFEKTFKLEPFPNNFL